MLQYKCIHRNECDSMENTKIYDSIETITTNEAYEAARLIGRKEGVLVGISSGAAAHAAKIKANNVDRHMIVNIFFFIITSIVNNTSLR